MTPRNCFLLCIGALGTGLPGVVAADLRFQDRSSESGIGFRHHANPTPEKHLVETMGGGVALADFDNDGYLDIFFVNGGAFAQGEDGLFVDRSGPELHDRLYRSRQGLSFEDVTKQAGVSAATKHIYGMGAATGDYDNDGYVDLFVTGYGGTILYRNLGGRGFEDRTEAAGANVLGWSASAGFFDADLDGDLDLFVTRYLDWSLETSRRCGEKIPVYCSPREYPAIASVLLRNEGDGTFSDVSREWGIDQSRGKALGVAFNDADADGSPDVVVANDSTAQQLFLNRGPGGFSEEALFAGLAYNEDGGSFAGMGVDFEDYDNDGRPDVVATALAKELYPLFRNEADGTFAYVTRQTGLAEITARLSGWSVKFADFNHDGWKDLFAAQSHVLDNVEMMEPGLVYLQPPLIALNLAGRFVDIGATAGPVFQASIAGRGTAFGDLDNDGDIDLVVGVLDDHPKVLYSNASEGESHWLQVQLVGRASVRDGQGASVRVRTGSGKEQVRYATTAGGYLSANDPRLHFGLGSEPVVSRIAVRWPSGAQQVLKDIEADRVI
ncbi:MAG: CRTAC1 family protein, partial [Acidobacteriia bacterium]|nr:CRTAC1 family protein [Terriglobia bacterium]